MNWNVYFVLSKATEKLKSRTHREMSAVTGLLCESALAVIAVPQTEWLQQQKRTSLSSGG